MTDPFDKDQVGLGSQELQVEVNFDSNVLVTFEGDFAKGLAGISVVNVEVVERMRTVDFGEIEFDRGRDDDPEDGDSANDNA
jgi:hypothetical protein